MLQTLIQPNGSGSWLLGYLPVRDASGGVVLMSKYYFEHAASSESATVTATTATATDTAATESKARDLPDSTEQMHAGTQAPGDADATHHHQYHSSSYLDILPALSDLPLPSHSETSTHANSINHPTNHTNTSKTNNPTTSTTTSTTSCTTYNYSQHCERLMMETAVRVVELRPHPLGRRDLLVVLEFVHNSQWGANLRFVSLDVFQVVQAILLAGQLPPAHLGRLEILDQKVRYEQCFI